MEGLRGGSGEVGGAGPGVISSVWSMLSLERGAEEGLVMGVGGEGLSLSMAS